jgi:hypothetical protein
VDLTRVGVERQVADLEEGAAARGPAAEQSTHPSQQLLALERLDQVVVGAGVKALHPVLNAVTGGQHEDRHVALVAQPVGHFDAVDAGQAQVEHHQIGLEKPRFRQGFLAVSGDPHVITLDSQ